MRMTGRAALLGWGLWLGGIAGACKSSGGMATGAAGAGGTSGLAGASGTTGGGGALAGASGAGGRGGSGAAGTSGAGGQVRDCLPSCIVNLRRNCERPAVDGGSCIAGAGVNCYSNGVLEQISVIDGGQLAVYTLPDGRTICYQVLSQSSGLQHFETSSGQEVAEGMFADGGYQVTCNGTTQTVDINDPSCATLNLASCVADGGTCP